MVASQTPKCFQDTFNFNISYECLSHLHSQTLFQQNTHSRLSCYTRRDGCHLCFLSAGTCCASQKHHIAKTAASAFPLNFLILRSLLFSFSLTLLFKNQSCPKARHPVHFPVLAEVSLWSQAYVHFLVLEWAWPELTSKGGAIRQNFNDSCVFLRYMV